MAWASLSTNTKAAVVFYSVYGAVFFISLNITGVYGVGLMPLFPLQLERVGWAFTWLVQTIFDFYGAASCVSGVILYTEPRTAIGVMWTLLLCCGGCSFGCVWCALQLFRHGCLALVDTEPRSAPGVSLAAKLTLPLYALFFAAFFVYTSVNQPLIPLNTSDLSWNLWWLMTTCFDYYGVCLCYVFIICSTEGSWRAGLAWSCGALFIGTPASCAWIVKRLLQHGSLALSSVATASSGADQYSPTGDVNR